MASSKSDVDPIFEKQLRNLKLTANLEAFSRRTGQQVRWVRPLNWKGDVFNFNDITTVFDRSTANNQFVEAVADGKNPGTTGDLIATTTQIDYLACMERAFRARHSYLLPRLNALLSGRKAGQGSDQGTFIQAALEYVRRLVKQAKGVSVE